MSAQPRMRCRQIAEADLPAVADLLARGFPKRARAYWTRGLDRLGESATPPGFPRFGYLLQHEETIVGVILVIAHTIDAGTGAYVRCNLSSWYVDPAHRSHASLLSMVPLRHKSATFLNISAAPNTWATVEAQGFTRYTHGQMVAIPSLGRGEPGLRVERVAADRDPGPATAMPEATLLIDHARSGCISLVGTAPDGRFPFVFLAVRARQGRFWFPAVQLVYSRSTDDFVRFAPVLGRFLLRYGAPFVFLDADGAVPGLRGRYWADRARKYFKGAHRPALGDLAYTEFVLFGP